MKQLLPYFYVVIARCFKPVIYMHHFNYKCILCEEHLHTPLYTPLSAYLDSNSYLDEQHSTFVQLYILMVGVDVERFVVWTVFS